MTNKGNRYNIIIYDNRLSIGYNLMHNNSCNTLTIKIV